MARVLLIDDDPDLCEALCEWLSLRGHAVASRTQALGLADAVRSFRPDVILLDGVLPDARGVDVAGALAAAAPVVFISGLDRDALPPDARVLPKPVDLELLERTVREVARPLG